MTKREYLESIGYDYYDITGYHKIIQFTDSEFKTMKKCKNMEISLWNE